MFQLQLDLCIVSQGSEHLSSLGTAHLLCEKRPQRLSIGLVAAGSLCGVTKAQATHQVAAQCHAEWMGYRVLVQSYYSVGWAEHVLQCWQTRGRAPQIVPISTVTIKLGLAYKNGICQCFYPWIKSPQVPSSPEAVLKLVIVSLSLMVQVFFNLFFFVLNLRKIEFSYEPFQSGISITYSSMIHLVLISTDFQIRHFGSLSSWCQLPGSRCPIRGTIPPIIPQGRVLYLTVPPNCGVITPGVVSWMRSCFCLSCFAVGVLLSGPFQRKTISYVDVNFLCLWEEVSSGCSHTTMLNSPLLQFFTSVIPCPQKLFLLLTDP